jgi:hypothetical protein
MRHIALLLAALALPSCRGVDFTRELPEQRRWALNVERPDDGAAADPASGAGTLLVRRFTVSESFEDESMFWRRTDGFFAGDFTNLHLSPPSSQITSAAHSWMVETGRWETVVTEGATLVPEQVLRGHVSQLYGDLGGDDAPAAVIEVQFFLTDVSQTPGAMLHQETYSARVPMPERTGSALVAAYSTGLAQVFARFEAELGAAP